MEIDEDTKKLLIEDLVKSRDLYFRKKLELLGKRKLELTVTSSSESNDESTSTKEYVQFNITYMYPTVRITGKLKKIINNIDEIESNNNYDHSVIYDIASEIPVSYYHVRMTVSKDSKGDEDSKKEPNITDSDEKTLKKEFQKAKEKYLQSMKMYFDNGIQNSEVRQTIKDQTTKSLEEFGKLNDLLTDSAARREELLEKSADLYSRKKLDLLGKRKLDLTRVLRKKQRKTRHNKLYKTETSSSESDDESTSTKEYVQFNITYVYPTVRFTGKLKKIFSNIDEIESNNNYDRSVIYDIASDVLLDKFGMIPELSTLSSQVGQWLSNNNNRHLKQQFKTAT